MRSRVRGAGQIQLVSRLRRFTNASDRRAYVRTRADVRGACVRSARSTPRSPSPYDESPKRSGALANAREHSILSQVANNNSGLDLVFYALADPTRRAVVQRLGKGSATVSELAEPFDMALPSFLKHVSVLEQTGLIRSTKEGRVRTCLLQRKRLAAAERWFDEQRSLWASRYANLDNLLENLKDDDET